MRNKNKKKITPRKFDEPVNDYMSVCCGVRANKPPCSYVPRAERGKTAQDTVWSTLGTWRCEKCKQKCKVRRSARKEAA